LVMENLTSRNYSLWEKKEPLTRNHLRLVIKEYAKFHAISVAMIDQCPEKYDFVIDPLKNLINNLSRNHGNAVIAKFAEAIGEVADLLEGDLDDKIVLKWRQFGKYMENEFVKIVMAYDGLMVVNHGDCWNNNFMFQ